MAFQQAYYSMISLGSMNVRNLETTEMTNKRAATEIFPDWAWAWTSSYVWEQKKKLIGFETCTLVNQRR
jgi:hypothetical protein